MKRLLLLIPMLATACSGSVETVTLGGQVKLPQAAASAFKIEGAPVLIANFDGSLGKTTATTLDAGGRFMVRIERESLPEKAQWFKLAVMHPSLNGPMLSRAVVLSRSAKNDEKLVLSPFSSLIQMAVEYQYQLDPAKAPTTLAPLALEETLAGKGDAIWLDTSFHVAYARYASGSIAIAPAADSELAAEARALLFGEP